MILQVGADHFGRGGAADVHCGGGRQRARIGGEQIAPGRQHIAAAACRRARGAGCDAAAIERRDQSRAFSLDAIVPSTVVAACGSAPENVLAIFDGEVLEIAEPGVDAFERLISGRGSIDASFAGEAAALRRFDDQSGKPLTPMAANPVYDSSGEIPVAARGTGIQTIDGFMTRTPFESQVDLQAAWALKIGGTRRLTLMASCGSCRGDRR